MEPDQVMRMSSAITARATELLVQLHRAEGKREWSRTRTMQVQPLLAELDRQFKIASRLLEVRRQDLQLETGRS
jgi:cytosine/adenosine deaminase-related metal-dependent hydrolase